MFLLILNGETDRWVQDSTFTFQYVSINTQENDGMRFSVENLHSNMFLLIQEFPASSRGERKGFTFQYVSINTYKEGDIWYWLKEFTFQYVSINTEYDEEWFNNVNNLHSNMFLLIPVSHTCLYFNTLQYHFCLPKQLSTYSFTISLRTAVSALIFRTVDLYYFLHYYKSTITT